MRVFYYLIFAVIVVCGSYSLEAHAQELDMALPATQQSSEDAMDDVPDEYIAEAHAYYDRCTGDYNQSQYYNCECLSLAYLDARIKNGPTASPSSIALEVSQQCIDAVGAAGPTYQSCLDSAYRFRPGTDPEKYCECVANTYVKNVNRTQPTIEAGNIINLRVRSYLECDENFQFR